MSWRTVLAVVLLVVSTAACVAVDARWLADRRRDNYGYNDRNNAIRLFGVSVIGVTLAIRLLTT